MKKAKIVMTNEKPYQYLRYIWFQRHNLNEIAEELSPNFTIVKISSEKKENTDKHIAGFVRDEIEVKADTLNAFLQPDTAILFQREKSPFTKKDIELRKILLELYPHNTRSPIPMAFSTEPKFEVKPE